MNPEATTLYTATAIGPGGTVTKNISLKVPYPTPTVTFSASPQVVIKGEGTTLTWETENAESVIIRPNIGSVQMSGSSVISSLTADTTYIITVIGKAETITKSLEVTIARGTISGTIPI